MAQTQFRSDDTDKWNYKFGTGSDGAYAPSTGTDAPVDSACSGTSGTTSLSATNVSFAIGQFILIHQTQGTGAGNWELNKIAVYSAGTITTAKALKNTYGTGAQVLVMPQYSSGNIAGGVTITGKAWNGTVGGIYAKFCNGTFTIAGALVGTGVGFRGGAISTVNGVQSYQGEGGPGLGIQSNAANGNGGGGDNGGAGSGGGNAAVGTPGITDNSTTGGAIAGVANLTTMQFGGGGSGGQWGGAGGAVGGAGGGIVIIIAKTISVTGTVSANGNAGASLTRGGGGGAGGNVLLKGQAITMGTSLITCALGVGGSGTDKNGGAGSVGRIHADYSTSISGTTSPTIDTTNDLTLADAAAFLPFFQ